MSLMSFFLYSCL